MSDSVVAQLQSVVQQVQGERVDYLALRRQLDDARAALTRESEQAQARLASLADTIARQTRKPAEQQDRALISDSLSLASRLVVGIAALAAVIAALATTGGLLTLASLSVAAGHTFTVATLACGACTCGRLTAAS